MILKPQLDSRIGKLIKRADEQRYYCTWFIIAWLAQFQILFSYFANFKPLEHIAFAHQFQDESFLIDREKAKFVQICENATSSHRRRYAKSTSRNVCSHLRISKDRKLRRARFACNELEIFLLKHRHEEDYLSTFTPVIFVCAACSISNPVSNYVF